MDASTAEVEKGCALSQQTTEALEEMVTLVTGLSDETKALGETAKRMSEDRNIVTKSIDSVSDVSLRTASGSQELCASADEIHSITSSVGSEVSNQLSVASDVDSAAQGLADRSASLKEALSQFTLPADANARRAA